MVGDTAPDLTLILDLPAEIGLARAASAAATRKARGPTASRRRTPLSRRPAASLPRHRREEPDALRRDRCRAGRRGGRGSGLDGHRAATAAGSRRAERSKAPCRVTPRTSPEPDRLEGAPHPREQFAFFGHAEAEGAFVDGMRSGRLHHAWLIGGPAGHRQGDLRLPGRPAPPRPSARCPGRDARRRPPGSAVARQVAALSHPNLAVLRRAPADRQEGAFGHDSGRRRAPRPRRLRLHGGRRRLSGLHRRQRRGPDDRQRQRAPEGDRGTAAALGLPDRQPRPAAAPADDPLPLPAPAVPPPPGRGDPGGRRLDRETLDGRLGGPAAATPCALGEGSVRRTLEMLDEDKMAFVAQITEALDALPQHRAAKNPRRSPRRLARRDAEEDLRTRPRHGQPLGEQPPAPTGLPLGPPALRRWWRCVRRSPARRARSTSTISIAGPSSSRCSTILPTRFGGRPEPLLKDCHGRTAKSSTSRRPSRTRMAPRISATPMRWWPPTRSRASSASTATTCSS